MLPRITLPEVGRSSPAAQCSNVLLPDPDGPITAVKLPLASPTLTSSSAVTAFGPEPYTLDTDSSWTAGVVVATGTGISNPNAPPPLHKSRCGLTGVTRGQQHHPGGAGGYTPVP